MLLGAGTEGRNRRAKKIENHKAWAPGWLCDLTGPLAQEEIGSGPEFKAALHFHFFYLFSSTTGLWDEGCDQSGDRVSKNDRRYNICCIMPQGLCLAEHIKDMAQWFGK